MARAAREKLVRFFVGDWRKTLTFLSGSWVGFAAWSWHDGREVAAIALYAMSLAAYITAGRASHAKRAKKGAPTGDAA